MGEIGVVFDFGRVLGRGAAAWTAEIVDHYGLTPDEIAAFFRGPEAIETQLGGTPYVTDDMVVVMANRLAGRLGERAEAAAQLLCAMYLEPERVEYDEPMIDLAQELHDAGIRVGILTNGPADSETGNMVPVLSRGCVDSTVISGRDGVGKPAEAAFQLMLERLGVTAADACFIDDHEFQAEAARALGIRSFVYGGDEEQVRSWLRSEGFFGTR